MPSRKVFLEKAAVAAAAISASAVAAAQLTQAQPSATSAPAHPSKAKPPIAPLAAKPSPKASPGPSRLARELAASLQHDLPNARLSDTMTEKIASDINDNFAINKAFRNKKKRTLPAPDFMFTAAESDQP